MKLNEIVLCVAAVEYVISLTGSHGNAVIPCNVEIYLCPSC